MSQSLQVTYAKFATTRKHEPATESARIHKLSPPPEFLRGAISVAVAPEV